QSNAEIDAYVCATIRNRALNALRRDSRRRQAGEVMAPAPASTEDRDGSNVEPADPSLSPHEQAISAELLGRAEKLLLSWPASDRYVVLARLHGVPTRMVQRTLEQPPFGVFLTAG